MKKVSPIILSTVFSATILLSGCSSVSTNSGSSSSINSAVSNSAAESTAVATEVPTEAEKSQNIVVFDQNGIKVTYLGYESGIMPELKFQIENSSDKSYTVSSDDVSFNDCMINTMILETVAPGKKVTTSMTFFESDLTDNGIEKIEKVEFKLHCTNSDDFLDSFDSDVLVINNP